MSPARVTTTSTSRRHFLARAGALSLAVPTLCAAGAKAPPNIVIIMADDLGYGGLKLYGGEFDTPNIEAMARDGLRFTDFHASAPVCSPTRAGLMTGRYQERAGIPGVIYAGTDRPVHFTGLKPSEVTFPRLLKEAGYVSALCGKWHLGYYPEFNPLNHGFDAFHGFVSGNIDYISHLDNQGRDDWWNGLEKSHEEGYLTHLITRHAVAFIEKNAGTPFCLYVAHGAPHTPLQGPDDAPVRGPDAKQGESDVPDPKKTYGEMIAAVDESVGAIRKALDAAGAAGNTLVLFCSDNGGDRSLSWSNGPGVRGHKSSLYEGGHRVPAVAVWPGVITPGTVTDSFCTTLDLMPTMLAMAGAAIPEGHRLDGQSMLPVLRGVETWRDRSFYWAYGMGAVREGYWKLVNTKDGPELYDLKTDPQETTNLASAQPERVNAMQAGYKRFRDDVTPG